MFDFGFSELLLIGVVMLIVLGPERLPKVAHQAGIWLGKIRRFSSNMKAEFNRQAELESLRQVRDEFQSAVHEVENEWRQTSRDFSDGMNAFDNLPAQRTPADFGVDEFGQPLVMPRYDTTPAMHMVSLRRQAINRRRDMRPRFRVKPKLRVRR